MLDFTSDSEYPAPETIVERALAVLRPCDPMLYDALEDLPAPVYVTDAEGIVVYFNTACIQFAGRAPVIGEDRWCVTWKLFTNNGEFLPHERCPMADAIVNRHPIRGVMAVAERPDGTKVDFMPFPTPFFDEDRNFRGAVNILIDITDQRQAALLRAQAQRCARLSRNVSDRDLAKTLIGLAHDYEAKALSLESRNWQTKGLREKSSAS